MLNSKTVQTVKLVKTALAVWAVYRQGPHLTSKKSDGRTKGLKRAFLTLRAIFSAKNGGKLKNGLFSESAVHEFSENGFGSEKN